MILSEREAKRRACPLMSTFVRAHSGDVRAMTQHCLASGCMKWRWVENHSPEEVASRKEFKMPTPEQPKGYCGA